MKHLFYLSILLSVCITSFSQSLQNYETHGPKKGTLIIIGGGSDHFIIDKFRELAGGDSAKLVIIPTALPDDYLQQDSSYAEIKKYFSNNGFNDITIVHTRDTAHANSEEFIQPIKKATAIYFEGGRQWRIADGFLNTKAHREMVKLLGRGGVIAGSSAGATIQGSYLARGDSKNNQIMMGDHEEGLGFITNVAIDQHVLARNRQFDLFDILKNRPELLGIGIDESTAIVVQADTLEVFGENYVLIYDKTFWSREGSELKHLPDKDQSFYFLKAGDKYNLAERKVIE